MGNPLVVRRGALPGIPLVVLGWRTGNASVERQMLDSRRECAAETVEPGIGGVDCA
jgi:hypothetical protein